jgi:Protein of unknown function (DUF2281)
MNDTLLYDKISALPKNIKSEVAAFVDTLIKEANISSENKKPKLGSGKGLFIMHDDFDEPLEDFKDYM